ncbi:MAG: glycoside hydrolase family 15 protein [Actinomycetota bacterium]|nr:glycoside hydrolase family 15 protein [Actinomycetota bacterium]
MPSPNRYVPIGDYALIGDCHTAALVSRQGNIDWCCLPRFDSGSAFARLLDAERGGYCSVAPSGRARWEISREYLEDTLVLQTTYQGSAGEARVLDLFLPSDRARHSWERRLLRVVEVLRGSVSFALHVAPRFDYGEVRPWIRRHGHRVHSATGGNDAIVVFSEVELEEFGGYELTGQVKLSAGQRVHLLLAYTPPEAVPDSPPEPQPEELDRELDGAVGWWRRWCKTLSLEGLDQAGARRSAIVLKAMTHTPTGAIVAAPTTSLPEVVGGVRNWDYRFAWLRDSSFSSRAFAEVGCEREADAFRAFVMRSAAGHADDLQVLYGVGGERRLKAIELSGLEGYRASAPVRVGNDASKQHQLDAYGEIVNLTWRWHRRGQSPGDDDWRFLVSLIDRAAEHWSEPDQGIWEWAGPPQHFVHSKVLCWAALDRGIRLSEECMRRAPTRRWKQARDSCRRAIEQRGFDSDRGCFVQAFDRTELDAALLLLPTVEFVDWCDERMVATVAAIREDLGAGGGLLYRYRRRDGLRGREGAFLCCSFWLVECLAHQDDLGEARAVYERTVAAGNDLGLFSEEADPRTGELLGNFPQGLTHLAHISATVALSEAHERL